MRKAVWQSPRVEQSDIQAGHNPIRNSSMGLEEGNQCLAGT